MAYYLSSECYTQLFYFYYAFYTVKKNVWFVDQAPIDQCWSE